MSETTIMIWALLLLAVSVVVIAGSSFLGLPCGGDCEQGRQPCNCKNKQEK